MTDLTASKLDALTSETVATELPDHLPPMEGEVLVLPDAHYPFHHSTGLVTAPPVLGGLLAYLTDETDATAVRVGVVDSPYVDSDRASEYLGYPDLVAEYDAELVDLGETAAEERSVTVDGDSVTLSVPEPLAASTVVDVPTVRRTEAFGTGAGLVNLARFLAPGEAVTEARIRAAHAAVETDLTLVDAYAVFTGQPFRTGLLFSGQGTAAVDRAVVDDVLDVADGDEVFPVPSDGPTQLSGVREADVPEDIPTQSLPSSSGILQKGYRFYTRLSGDALAPQSMEKK